MLPNSFCKASITLIPKSDKETRKKLWTNILHGYRCRNSKKILTNQIQQYINRIIHHDQVGFIPGMQGLFTSTNQCDTLD